ncbi:hypothetical protein ACFL0W_05960 [Nanoarchaeota archaeon]
MKTTPMAKCPKCKTPDDVVFVGGDTLMCLKCDIIVNRIASEDEKKIKDKIYVPINAA